MTRDHTAFSPRPDGLGIRPADRVRAAFFLRRLARRLRHDPDCPFHAAVAAEWRTDPTIPIAAVAAALDAVQLATDHTESQTAGVLPTAIRFLRPPTPAGPVAVPGQHRHAA